MPDPILRLTFSQEEIALLLYLMRVPYMLGVGSNPLEGLTQAQAVQALSSADRSLRARGMIAPKAENIVEIDPFVLGLVAPCAMPEVSILVSRSERGAPAQVRLLHRAKGLEVEHTLPEQGLHRFEALIAPDSLHKRLASLLPSRMHEYNGQAMGSLTREQYNRARDAVQTGEGNLTLPLFQEAGLLVEDADLLIKTLHNPEVEVSFGFVMNISGEALTAGFTLLEGLQSLWILEDSSPESTTDITLYRVPSAAPRIRLDEYVAQINKNFMEKSV